jgi:hypothetical protein
MLSDLKSTQKYSFIQMDFYQKVERSKDLARKQLLRHKRRTRSGHSRSNVAEPHRGKIGNIKKPKGFCSHCNPSLARTIQIKNDAKKTIWIHNFEICHEYDPMEDSWCPFKILE